MAHIKLKTIICFAANVIQSTVARQQSTMNIAEFNLGERFPFDSKINDIRAL